MRGDLERLARLALKLLRQEPLGPADVDEYLPTGRRVNEFADRTGAERMVEMLVRKLRKEPYTSEVVVPQFDRVPPAPPVRDLRTVTLGLVTTAGVVRAGNPEGIESWRATRWARYPLAGVEAPKYEDSEKSLADLIARVEKTIAWLNTMKTSQIDGTEEKPVTVKLRDRELNFKGAELLLNRSLPNFLFHATTAYDIMRHNGVEIGKRDFMGMN